MKYKRVFTIVVDSFGIGHASDAKEFDDEGAHTFGHIFVIFRHISVILNKSLSFRTMFWVILDKIWSILERFQGILYKSVSFWTDFSTI